jgi:multicomponent Na+:H+ antiporter subunit G
MSSLTLALTAGMPPELRTALFWAAVVLIAGGAAFDLLGCIGLVRLPDVYNRLQAATKCVTLGTCSILLGAALWMLYSGADFGAPGAVKALLCLAFILVSSPVAAHAIARGAHRSGIRLWDGSVGDEYLEDKSRRSGD